MIPMRGPRTTPKLPPPPGAAGRVDADAGGPAHERVGAAEGDLQVVAREPDQGTGPGSALEDQDLDLASHLGRPEGELLGGIEAAQSRRAATDLRGRDAALR